MGELLAFPGGARRATAPAEQDEQEGAEQRSAPSRLAHPSTPLPPDLPQAVEEIGERPARGRRPALPSGEVEHALDAAAESGQDEPRWAVPGVDDGAADVPEPTRSSKRAENVALAALTRHDASEGEIRAKLVAKGLEEEDVEAELERLRRVGLIDDVAFAARLIERLRDRKGLGDQAIRSTLRGRLVPQSVIDVVLVEQAEDEETAEARLQEVAEDRARRLGSLAPDVAERRLTAYLMRKGYSGSAVRTAVRAALQSAGLR